LVKRRDFRIWTLPGGHIENGESPFQTAKREVLEETGVEIADLKFVSVYSKPQWYNGGDITILIKAETPTLTVVRADPTECMDAKMCDTEDLPELTAPWHIDYISDARDNVAPDLRVQNYEWPFPGDLRWKDIVEMIDAGRIDVEEMTSKYKRKTTDQKSTTRETREPADV
jgi:8-oxo-dGTP pyrophosphatase MutT (NUDIX family)